MGGTWKERVKNLFPADGLGWKIPGLVAALITIVVGTVALLVWASDDLSDFLTADVEVWHLLLAVAGAGAVGIIAAWRVRRTTFEEDVGTSGIVPYPQEVKHFGVIWPIRTVIVGGTRPQFRADMPACPKDRNPLGMAVEDEEEGKNILVPLDDLPWKDFVSDRMRFGCFNDGTIYDLTQHECGMGTALKIVQGMAEGEYRTTLARVRGEAGH